MPSGYQSVPMAKPEQRCNELFNPAYKIRCSLRKHHKGEHLGKDARWEVSWWSNPEFEWVEKEKAK